MPIVKLRIYRTSDIVEVMIIPHKGTDQYSYINLTKGHICPCKFNSIEEAISDLSNYKEIISYEYINNV